MGRKHVHVLHIDAENLQQAANEPLDRCCDRRKQKHHHTHDRRDDHRKLVGVGDGERLRQDLGKHQHQGRHRQGRVGNAAVAKQPGEQHRGQRGGEDVDQIVAEQQRADQPFARFGQLADEAGAFVACLLALHHARATPPSAPFRSRRKRRKEPKGRGPRGQ